MTTTTTKIPDPGTELLYGLRDSEKYVYHYTSAVTFLDKILPAKARMDGALENAKKGDGVVDANRLRSLLGTIFTEWCERNPGAAHPVRAVRKARNGDGSAPRPRTNKLTVDQARAYSRALERYAAVARVGERAAIEACRRSGIVPPAWLTGGAR